jgi:hypothetical protein
MAVGEAIMPFPTAAIASPLVGQRVDDTARNVVRPW